MNAFRKWLYLTLPLIALAAGAIILLAAQRSSHAHEKNDWLMWWLLTTPFYALGLGGKSRPCRKPRWLGGR